MAKRLAKTEEDLVATIKVLSAMLFFPLSWMLAAMLAWRALGAAAGAAALCLAPLSGYAALVAVEQAGHVRAGLRGLRYAWFEPEAHARLRADGAAIHARIRKLT